MRRKKQLGEHVSKRDDKVEVLAVQLLRESVAGLSTQRTRFVSTMIHIELTVENTSKYFSSVTRGLPLSINIPPMHIYSHIT